MVGSLYALQIFMASPSILNSFLILETLGHSFSVICHPLQNGTFDSVNYGEVACLPQRAPASFPLHSPPLQQRAGEKPFAPGPPHPWSCASMQCPIQPAGGTARGQWVCPSSSRHHLLPPSLLWALRYTAIPSGQGGRRRSSQEISAGGLTVLKPHCLLEIFLQGF